MASPATGSQRTGHTLAFTSPVGVAIIVLAVMGVIALGFLLAPRGSVPVAGGSPSLAATAEPGTPSVEPSPPFTPTPTVTPAPTPTPIADWTGLVWSDPVTPSFTVHLNDLLRWGQGYVAVGEVPGQGPWASLTSPDGLNWTVEQRDFPGAPRHLVALGDELFAFMPEVWLNPPGTITGAPPTSIIWRSTDGSTWALVDSPSWQDAWHEAVPDAVVGTYPDGWDQTQHDLSLGVVDVASGPDGLVAIGNSFGDDAMAPIILQSTDGQSWTAGALPAGSDSALLNAVAEHDGRFVITGATGVWTDPADATAAAWYSDDGLTWVRATVEPNELGFTTSAAEFGPLWAADDGLLTCRGDREMAAGGWRYMDGWVSSDGTSWRSSSQPGPHPACDWSASDGARIVSLGPRDHASPTPWAGVTLASTSNDGVEWQSLELSSTLTDRLERFWVVPDGVIYAGVQSFWFGTPQIEE